MSAIKTLTPAEIENLLEVLSKSSRSPHADLLRCRNLTMVLLMLDAGLRVGEVVSLLISDLWFNHTPKMAITVSAEVAKNKRERIIPTSHRIVTAIEAMNCHVWSAENLFENHRAFYAGYGRRSLSVRQVERIIQAAGINAFGREITPHMLRHTFATRVMRGTSIRTVQELLGHTSLASTQIYTHPNSDDLKVAIAKL